MWKPQSRRRDDQFLRHPGSGDRIARLQQRADESMTYVRILWSAGHRLAKLPDRAREFHPPRMSGRQAIAGVNIFGRSHDDGLEPLDGFLDTAGDQQRRRLGDVEPGVGRPTEGLVIGSEELLVSGEREDQLVQSPVGVEVQWILRHCLPERGDRFLATSEMLQNIGLVVSKVRKTRRLDFRAFEVRKGAGEIALRTTRPAQLLVDQAQVEVRFPVVRAARHRFLEPAGRFVETTKTPDDHAHVQSGLGLVGVGGERT